jgi:hypothetical protein
MAKVTRIEQLRRIVENCQYEKIDGHVVDGVTANMLVNVHDALNEDARKKFLGLDLMKMVRVGWKLVS